jgi:1,4-dihydroxy-2-naphthoyl-CoA synthase
MITDEVLVEKLGSVTTIGINRPQKRNCVNMATAFKLSRAILEFEEDDSALVGVLHGIGGNFCAGYDLEELSEFDIDMGLDNEAGHGPMVSSYIANICLSFMMTVVNFAFQFTVATGNILDTQYNILGGTCITVKVYGIQICRTDEKCCTMLTECEGYP